MSTPENGACEVTLIEMLRWIPEDARIVEEKQWIEDGTAIGHSYHPVGRLAHRAADELQAARAELDAIKAMFDKAELLTKFSLDGGVTWQPWPLEARVRMCIASALDTEDEERAERAEQALAEAKEDAERYRWLRDASTEHGDIPETETGWWNELGNVLDAEFDSMIDAARAARSGA